jgi:glycosyltransferase involved in cell wall biosynthesis
MPLATALLTCYNHVRHLPEALDSIRGQTVEDIEILAVDDGSTDGTREYLAQQPDVRTVLNERNLGTYASLNVGLRLARSPWVAILNDDDLWEPAKLERQLASVSSDVAVCCTYGSFVDDQGNPVEGSPQGFPFPRLDAEDPLNQLARSNRIIVSSAMLHRETILSLGGFDATFFGYGDWHLWLRVAKAGLGFVFLDEPLTRYRVHSGQASRQSRTMEEEALRIREWITEWDRELTRESAAFNWRCLGASREMFGQKARAREAYLRSFRMHPTVEAFGRWLLSPFARQAFAEDR